MSDPHTIAVVPSPAWREALLGCAPRFWSKVSKTNGCWLWTAGRHGKGYGQFYLNGRTLKAHRMAYMLTNGEIPDGMHVLHRCDVPACVNPHHLFVGTNQENVDDKVRKDRQSRLTGEMHPCRKLSKADVAHMRSRRSEDRGVLASEFGVDRSTVNRIIRGASWSHL